MAAEKQDTYFGQCRCCRKQTYLKNMWYTATGQEEVVYGQMLVDCFSIDWMIQGRVEDDKICEACISKLKVAISFKDQVLQSQAGILDDNKAKLEIKEESVEEEDDIGEEDIGGEEDIRGEEVDAEEENESDEDESINEINERKTYEEVEFLEEEVLEDGATEDDQEPAEKKRKWPKKRPPYERYKQYRQYSEGDLKMAVEKVRAKKMTTVKASEVFKIPRKTISKKLYDDTDAGGKDQRIPDEEDTILNKHRENIRSILVASNATPIKGHWGFGYACYFCPQQFADPSQLKQHTFTHGSHIPIIKVKSLTDHIIKLDVTHLKCNICEVDIKSLDDMMLHLKEQHKMLMHLDLPNHIVPFSFAGDNLSCVKCAENFDSFKSLSEHMNDVHYRNYECVICRRGFVNIRALKTHSIAHGINIFTCTHCYKVFTSRTEMEDHEKTHSGNITTPVKILRKNARKTGVSTENICSTIFYGTDPLGHSQKCAVCGKYFENKCDLLYHINSVHKPHKCTICGSTFDFQFRLKKHISKEHPLQHKCPKCFKMFLTEHLLQEHMLEHKEFSCEVCCCQFSEEQSYLVHMKDNHGLE